MSRRDVYLRVSRATDVTMALLGLAAAAPILALAAAAVLIESGRPVAYKGQRVGRDGRLFRIFKFRTMVKDAEALGSSVTRASDERITGVGRFLRRSKLDELPQLWNVIRGEMAFVGPRPDVPEIVRTYTREMRRALEARPGITSVASLWLRNESDLLRDVSCPDEVYETVIVPAKVELALTHLNRCSLAFDWGVLLATIGAWIGVRRPSAAERRFLSDIQARIAAFQERNRSAASASTSNRRELDSSQAGGSATGSSQT